MTVGAELSTLRDLEQTFKNNAQAALDIKTAVGGSVNASVWTGKFADDFRQAWEDYSKNLDTLNQALTDAERDVRTNGQNIAAATGESY